MTKHIIAAASAAFLMAGCASGQQALSTVGSAMEATGDAGVATSKDYLCNKARVGSLRDSFDTQEEILGYFMVCGFVPGIMMKPEPTGEGS